MTDLLRRTIVFGGLQIAFDDRVLRPRTWTENQSRWAAELLPHLPDGQVLELCSGAGQIGLLAVAGSGRRLVCVDVNPVAAELTTANAAAAGLSEQVEMREGPIGEVLSPDERFPLILTAIETHRAPAGVALLQLGPGEQVAAVAGLLEGTRIRAGESRDFGDRGVLLRIDHRA
jgi:hypothetical protein